MRQCRDELPNAFRAAAAKLKSQLESQYNQALVQAGAVVAHEPDLKANLERLWTAAEKLTSAGKDEGAVARYDELPPLLEQARVAHVRLPFSDAWAAYEKEFQRVTLSEDSRKQFNFSADEIRGPVQEASVKATAVSKAKQAIDTLTGKVTAVAAFEAAYAEYEAVIGGATLSTESRAALESDANDIRLPVQQLASTATTATQAKDAIGVLKGKVPVVAKFDADYPAIKHDYDDVLTKDLRSQMVATLNGLHTAALTDKISDPPTAAANLLELKKKVVAANASLANGKASTVPKPTPQGGSGFETATDETTALKEVKKVLEDGGITLANVGKLVPTGTKQKFKAKAPYTDGFKYKWSVGSMEYTVYGHGPTVNPSVAATSDSKKGNLVRVKIGDKYLQADGSLSADAFSEEGHLSLY